MRVGTVIVIALLAPAATADPKPDQVAAETAVTFDDFTGVTSYDGPEFHGAPLTALVRGRKTKDGSFLFQLCASDFHDGDWKFYERAVDQNGRGLAFVSLDRKVVSCVARPCSVDESFCANIGKADLESAAKSSYAVRFYAKSGATPTVRIAPDYARGILMAVEWGPPEQGK
jgi:hypothetical protein